MNEIKLSICIATLNRAAFIRETLECICAQIQDGVEVVVVDGASSDGTDDVVRTFERSHRGVRFLRQNANGGIDRDFDMAVSHARGEYCWLMSDDDLIGQGAIQAVLTCLRDQAPSLVVVNAGVWTKDFSEKIEDRRLRIDTNQAFEVDDLDRLFLEIGAYLTFIGCVVIRRQVWLDRNRERYFGSLFVHMGVIFQHPLPARAIAMAEPWIRIRYGNAMWKPREFEVWMVRWPDLVQLLDGVSPEARATLFPPPSLRQVGRLLVLRAKGAYTLTQYRQWIVPRRDALWFRALAFLVALCPGVLLNGAALLLFARNGRGGTRSLDIVDLRSSRYYFRSRFNRSARGSA
jgi:abequosyltransferase